MCPVVPPCLGPPCSAQVLGLKQGSACRWCLDCGCTVMVRAQTCCWPVLVTWDSLGCVWSLANARCSFTGKCFNWKFPRPNWAQKLNADVP